MTEHHARRSEPDSTLAERLAPMSIADIDAMSDREVAALMGATPQEIATEPAANTAAAGAQLRSLRSHVIQAAAERSLAIGSAGTHPFAMWEDQRIVARPRYRDLVSALRFVARQELIFGMHVHVGIDDPDKAIHVANGMRVHVPVLLGLSANSPFWRADHTGLASVRTPIAGPNQQPACQRLLGRGRQACSVKGCKPKSAPGGRGR